MPVRNIPVDVTDMVYSLVRGYHGSDAGSDLRRWYKKMLSTACRHIEYFITPRVSIKAYQTALKFGIQDLTVIPWRPPSAWPLGSELIFEHAYPASDIVNKILSFQNPVLSDIEFELYKAEIVWIHRHENLKLKKNNRLSWQIEYAKAGIDLIAES